MKSVLDEGELDKQFADIIGRVLLQLEEMKGLEANASFDCLRETMQLYLQQINSRDVPCYICEMNPRFFLRILSY